MRGANGVGLWCLVGLAAVLSCRDATQIRVRVETTLNCPGDGPNELRDASILAGDVGKIDGPAQAVASACERKGSPNYVGDLIVFPRGDKDAAAEVWVVAALDNGSTDPPAEGEVPGATSADCLSAYQNARDRFPDTCIISKRRLGFVPHEELSLTIALDINCAGKACEPDTTCYRNGECGDAEVACEGSSCSLPGEGQGDTGATSGTGASTDGASGSGDASSTATTGSPSSNASTSASSSSGGGEGGGPACLGSSSVQCIDANMCAAVCGAQGKVGCCEGGACFCACTDDAACNAFCVGTAMLDSGTCADVDTCQCMNGGGGAGGGGGACSGTAIGNGLCPDEPMCEISCGVGRTGCCDGNTCFCACHTIDCNTECVGMGADLGSCVGDACFCEMGMGGAGGVGSGSGVGAGVGGAGPFVIPGGAGAGRRSAAEPVFYTRRFDRDPPTLASHVALTMRAAQERIRAAQTGPH